VASVLLSVLRDALCPDSWFVADTHYPEYFPVRQGFQSTLTQLQAKGVRVAPYINGRIFDVATQSWTNDGAETFAAKSAPASLNPNDLSLYYEEYGSEVQ
jgi:hypothetical protein